MGRATKKGWAEFKAAKGSIAKVCEYVAGGESLHSFALKNGFSPVTLLDWINSDQARSDDYAHAREARADMVFESLDEVSEQAIGAETAVEVAGLRLKADNIKWKLARMSPKKYGDKVQVGGAEDLPPLQQVHSMSTDALLAIAARAVNK